MADETTKMNLQHDVTVNGIKYRAGQNVTVPKGQADDLARIDFEATQRERDIMIKRSSLTNAGTIAAGGE